MARIIGEARRERRREQVLECLIACEGWMTVTMLHRAAFGGDSVTAAERDEALASLESAGMIVSRTVAKTVGRFGRTTQQYRYCWAVGTALSTEPCDHASMSLEIGDRLALLDLAIGIVTMLADTA